MYWDETKERKRQNFAIFAPPGEGKILFLANNILASFLKVGSSGHYRLGGLVYQIAKLYSEKYTGFRLT